MKSARIILIGAVLLLALIFSLAPADLGSFIEMDSENTQSSYSSTISPLDAMLVLNYIAAREGIPVDRLLPINQHTQENPELQASFLCVKAIDKETHQIYQAMLDLSSREILEVEEVETRNSSAYTEKYGKLEPQLYRMLQTKDSDDMVNVAVWLSTKDQQRTILEQLRLRYPQVPANAMERPWLMVKDKTQSEQIRKDYFELLKQSNLDAQKDLAQWLSERGYSARLHSGTPTLDGRFPKSIILQIAQRPDVGQIYMIEGKLVPLQDITIPTTEADNGLR